MTAGEDAGRLRDVVTEADHLELRMLRECLAQVRKPVTVAREVQAGSLGFRVLAHFPLPVRKCWKLAALSPSLSIEVCPSRSSGLSAAFATGRRASAQPAEFCTANQIFCSSRVSFTASRADDELP